jgi:hypothetical protein
MTRKDYQRIARVLHKLYHDDLDEDGLGQDVTMVMEALADLFSTYNKAFDRKKFLTACGHPKYDKSGLTRGDKNP